MFCRYLFCSQLWGAECRYIDKSLSDHVTSSTQHTIHQAVQSTIISHILFMPTTTLKEQFLLLSSIGNHFDIPYPQPSTVIRQNNGPGNVSLVNPKYRTGFINHMMHIPLAYNKTSNQVPTSPRNRLMHYVSNDKQSVVNSLINHYLFKDRARSTTDCTQDINETQNDQQSTRPAKKRRNATRLVKISTHDISTFSGEDLNTLLNSAEPNRNLYPRFKEQLAMEGCIKWRHHGPGLDVCTMTDYNSTKGNIIPGKFVHITCRRNVDGNPIISCTCEIYSHILGAAYMVNNPADDEILYPDCTITCMHCRYFKENLLNAYDKIQEQNTNLSWPLKQVHESLQHMNDPIILVGPVIAKGTTKFSVKGQNVSDSVAFLHITFNSGKCYARCMDGFCSAQMQNKKKIPKVQTLQNTSQLCCHIQTLGIHLDYVKSFFPGYFKLEDNPIEVGLPEEELNLEDAGIADNISGHFNTDTGLWEYPSSSKHIPKEMMDPNLVHHTQKRNELCHEENLDPISGMYMYTLKSLPVTQNGRKKQCSCGAHYSAQCLEQLDLVCTLYTRNAAMTMNCYNILCDSGKCKIPYEEEAEQRGIFFLTNKTAVADEVGWDFVSSVLKSKISFNSFCSEMTRRYETNRVAAPPFISSPTFIKYFFGWLSAFKIDFRKHVDPACKHSPKVLACDGTHIGVSVKNMNLEDAVTKPDIETELRPVHKRNDRLLIPSKDSRMVIKHLCRKYLGKLKPAEIMDINIESANSFRMLADVAALGYNKLTAFLLVFVQKTQAEETIICMARVLQMLCGDAAISTVVPFKSHQCILATCEILKTQNTLGDQFQEIRNYSNEIADLLRISIQDDCIDMVTDFLYLLISRVQQIHGQNRPVPPIQEKLGSYNPPTGVAYYFTGSGNQLREMPTYIVSGSGKNNNYDDHPEVDQACTKNFPGVSFGGFGYLFLWFCPIHGHSYGFHLIAGGEGRKDPFSSLFKYIQEPPDDIFYDFACQLNEYCLNREPELFKWTRFWHDLFHSIGHKCGCNFKSGRVRGLEGINTEICEQVNSFLQCIKYTASHLSQEHFVFFLQFFLYILNKDKTARHKTLASVALAGHM